MRNRKIALIGHSAAGKTSCLLELGIDPRCGDMDRALGAQESPTLAASLEWLTQATGDQADVVVSNHEEMLKAMQQAKAAVEFNRYFSLLCLVYLWKPKDRLTRHLEKPHPGGALRDMLSKNYTLQNYDRFHEMFQSMADCTIDCATKGVQEVAAAVRALSESLRS